MFKHGDQDRPEYENNEELTSSNHKILRNRYRRSMVSFWILGICNNFGYIVMLTGAADIIRVNSPKKENTTTLEDKKCAQHSTGIVVLAELAPSFVTIVLPFLPLVVHLRMAFIVSFTCIGFLINGFVQNSLTIALIGVALISFSSTIGELTLVQYAAYFNRIVLSTWSSGTGGAGVIGALSYTLGIESGYRQVMFGMLTIPTIMSLVFWVLLPSPTEADKQAVLAQKQWNEKELKSPWGTIKQKSRILPKALYKYILPLGLVYIFEYTVNQGMYELVIVKDNLVPMSKQYQWFQVAYQIGVFLSRSSVNLFYVKYIWAMSILQFLNLVIFTTNAIFRYIKNFWLLFVLALEEGLIGGAAYVNTYIKIGREEEEEDKQFISSVTCYGNNISILIAGFLSLLAHNLICKVYQS